MVFIAGGTAILGVLNKHPKNYNDMEQVSREVAGFYLDQTEVTAEKYAECVKSGRCSDTGPETDTKFADLYGCTQYDSASSQHPINCVNYDQATTYCEKWKLQRLPSRDEWEFAARGPVGRDYPWGGDPFTCDHAIAERFDTDSDVGGAFCKKAGYPGGTAAVGSSPKGDTPGTRLHDMAGNVWEWTAGTDLTHQQTKKPAAALYGGAWGFKQDRLFAYRRLIWMPYQASTQTGFRCAKSP